MRLDNIQILCARVESVGTSTDTIAMWQWMCREKLGGLQECAEQEVKLYFEIQDEEGYVCEDLADIKTGACLEVVDD